MHIWGQNSSVVSLWVYLQLAVERLNRYSPTPYYKNSQVILCFTDILCTQVLVKAKQTLDQLQLAPWNTLF